MTKEQTKKSERERERERVVRDALFRALLGRNAPTVCERERFFPSPTFFGLIFARLVVAVRVAIRTMVRGSAAPPPTIPRFCRTFALLSHLRSTYHTRQNFFTVALQGLASVDRFRFNFSRDAGADNENVPASRLPRGTAGEAGLVSIVTKLARRKKD